MSYSWGRYRLTKSGRASSSPLGAFSWTFPGTLDGPVACDLSVLDILAEIMGKIRVIDMACREPRLLIIRMDCEHIVLQRSSGMLRVDG